MRCYLLESIMLARMRGFNLLASTRTRPITHIENGRAYAAAAAAFR
jgi:hypothetical protein